MPPLSIPPSLPAWTSHRIQYRMEEGGKIDREYFHLLSFSLFRPAHGVAKGGKVEARGEGGGGGGEAPNREGAAGEMEEGEEKGQDKGGREERREEGGRER